MHTHTYMQEHYEWCKNSKYNIGYIIFGCGRVREIKTQEKINGITYASLSSWSVVLTSINKTSSAILPVYLSHSQVRCTCTLFFCPYLTKHLIRTYISTVRVHHTRVTCINKNKTPESYCGLLKFTKQSPLEWR